MEKQAQSIQDGFLNAARKEKTVVTVLLVNGAKLVGRIRSFDKYCVILESDRQDQLIFKHAISMLTLPRHAAVTAPATGATLTEG